MGTSGNEFDIYMQIGNQLEIENKIIMACAAYLEAMSKTVINDKTVIENYISMLKKNISGEPQQWNREVNEQLLQWIKTDEILLATACFENVYKKLSGKQWIDTENAILYQCFQIYKAEVKAGIKPWNMEGKSMEYLKEWYYQFKFMVRRIDMGMAEKQEFIIFIKEKKISKIALYEMIKSICYHPQRVYGYLDGIFRNNDMVEYSDFFKRIWNGKNEESLVLTQNVEADKVEKVAFIMAVTEEQIYNEAVYYINHLMVPKNIEIEIIPIREAQSITSAYNKGMAMTDAKYKVYMHQDTMLVNPYMLYEMQCIFQNKEIGMIGVAGASEIPENGMWWEGDQDVIYCNLYQDMIMEHNISSGQFITDEYKLVKVIDGVLMITQYDIPWREDLFQNWHFYDLSQSMEFNKKKYKIVIPKQKNRIWCLHEQKCNKQLGKQYYAARDLFKKEYREIWH